MINFAQDDTGGVGYDGKATATAKATADPYGMTTKETSNGKTTATATADPFGADNKKAAATTKQRQRRR